ncbi:MAG: hypothetical protein CML08_04055 [Puniceicoccaceae bacterium]|nr:hypothetical protein [Puniceicoccaceae bacterium]|tara:strand:+ start:1133 stop:2827 length:1695 start_codon:yes stop_codon:yes gene_type:complete
MKHGESRRDIIDCLNEINAIIYESYQLDKAFQTILSKACQFFKVEAGLIAVINEDRAHLEIEAHLGLNKDPEPIPLNIGIIGWTAYNRKARVIENFKEDSSHKPYTTLAQSGISLPMMVDNKVIGVLYLEKTDTPTFQPKDLEIGRLFASEASKVLSKIWLLKQLKSKNEQLHSLIKLNRKLASKLDWHSILNSLAQEANSLLNSHSCALFLFNTQKTHLDLHSMVGPKGMTKDSSQIDLRDSAIGGAVRRKKQIEIHNILYTEENAFNQIILRDKLHSMLVTPIIFQNEVIGVLNTYTDEMHRFSNDEKQIALALADLGAMTLENARLYEKTFASEEILRKNEKLTTLGLLSAEIAHEIRNPLTVIKLLFQTLDLKFPDSDPRAQDAILITEKINHLETIVERVLGFSHRNHSTKATYCLSKLTEESLQLVRLKLNQLKISVQLEKPEEEIYIDVNKGQIQQVMLNLIFNASQAMPKSGGSIHLKLFKHKKLAYFTIRDTGHGIPDGFRERIFESFLTNRSEGSGLGLSIAQGILSSHRGAITLLESSSEGTTFQFTLPLSNT